MNRSWRGLGSVAWVLPFATHVGYILATFDQLPVNLGGDGKDGTSSTLFIIEWFAILGLANLAFTLLHVRLPRLSDRMLAVPGRDYWLADDDRRKDLVGRLRGICEVALVMLNVFFLAVYQNVYQTNTASPIVGFPEWMIIGAFMAMPLLIATAYMLWVLHSLAEIARGNQ